MLLKIRTERQAIAIRQSRWRSKVLFWMLLPIVGIGVLLGYKILQSFFIQPEAVFVLGGHEDREKLAAQLAAQHQGIPIWVSSGSPRSYAKNIFAKRGVKSDRLHLDYQAKDTVTNFTTLADELKAQGIDSVYLVTSDNHMRRALLIGEIVFGSRGIVIKPIAVPSHAPPEPMEKYLRDSVRAFLWLSTGKTGETVVRP